MSLSSLLCSKFSQWTVDAEYRKGLVVQEREDLTLDKVESKVMFVASYCFTRCSSSWSNNS